MNMKFRLVGPRICHLTLPSTCDHHCPFCITDIHGKGRLLGRETLTFNQMKQIVDQALSELTLRFNFTSNGEPLLYPHLKDLIEYIHQQSKGKGSVQIITNGTSLKASELKFYHSRHVSFWISLHSSSYESWLLMHRPLHHQKEKFDTLKTNIQEISRLGIGLTLHCVVTRLNYKDLPLIADFINGLNLNQFSLTRLIDHEELKLSYEQEQELGVIVDQLKQRLNQQSIKHNLEGFEIMLEEDQNDDSTQSSFYQTNRCYLPFLMRPITDSGQIKSCNAGMILGSYNDKKTYLNEKKFLKAAVNIIKTNGVVDQCQCSSCPQLVMNKIANKYCF